MCFTCTSETSFTGAIFTIATAPLSEPHIPIKHSRLSTFSGKSHNDLTQEMFFLDGTLDLRF
jgi:hypothetical protein